MVHGLVSTIIPVHNRPRLLREAVASVLSQTYENFEIIIVDDGSDDPRMADSLAHCEIEGKNQVRVLRQANQGPGPARQAGLENARGEFIQFLDSDDLLYPNKYAAQVAVLARDPGAGVCYGKTRFVTSTGQVVAPWRRTGERIETMFPSMLAQRWWGTSTPLYRQTLMDRAGPIEALSNEEDWELDCRIAALGVRLAWVDEWVSEQRAVADNRASHGGSSEPAKLRDRARARELILQSALGADMSPAAPEFQQFIRYSFLVARQCAVAGLHGEAEHLVRCLHEAAPRALMRLYLLMGRWLGLGPATRITEALHALGSRSAKGSGIT